mmetsp:Transcript_3464/g.3955  ORF Transcript_3464/g.3955 Transcript_3464/m.3955 type:complete len:125 (-) Transcript_3464:789-1163(-)|eukprot:CAMPEP_0184013640 /NCGR_PEP_ID=MMETSP0954-20121128/5138_1 /TAXON_ID=627963 /ORGANISM="Aplanochytrium sp, Strain PBS07" /LENGTH=124 /DNA_ID=CAMNT_0026293877 /DNA_START=502 /DNA_END=876 /DNA_ORIENTATION=+
MLASKALLQPSSIITRKIFNNSIGAFRSVSKLSNEQVTVALDKLNGWSKEESGLAITKTYEFTDFISAFGFMSKVALAAEKADHHPEWFNVYNRVEVRLTTHDANGLSSKDIALAEVMDNYASS